MKAALFPITLVLVLFFTGCKQSDQLPNILWITSEDNSPLLGCYGDTFATTPHLDRFATEGFLYTNAYANTPVCAPARNTLLTGVYACSSGNEQMRSRYSKSEIVRPYTEFLLEKGYYCTNNSKTDYNFANPDLKSIWDESGREAHYSKRGEGQPFFAIFNLTISHESCLHKSTPDSLLRHRPEEVSLPPYHPDTPEMRHDWAQYYDKVEDMDTKVGELLAELEKAGLAENTIVFYYSDHGGVLGRSKRYLYETGTHVPMIIRIPEKYKKLFPTAKKGSKVDRLVSFVDLAPTLLSLTGTQAPDYMQGNAFLGKYTDKAPSQIYMFRDRMDGRYDMTRAVVDGRYRYIRYFNPNRIWMQHLDYLWRAPSMRSWERAYLAGECDEIQSRFWNTKPTEELFDIENDPWEVNNLAKDPAYADRLAKMRQALLDKSLEIRDAGFIPEADRIVRTGGVPAYDYMRTGTVPYVEIIQAAFLATEANPANLQQLLALLKNDDSAIRYWGAQGLLILGEDALPGLEQLKKAAFDVSWNVSIAAAEILYKLGDKETAIKSLKRVLANDQAMARTCALNCVDAIGEGPEQFQQSCKDIFAMYEVADRQYDVRVAQWLFEKWNVP
jgi:N-sulfoglucosamine sulfohydrolase